MPSYRGIAQADLLKSVNDALELLETHSTGPEMQKMVDDLRKPGANGVSPLGAVAVAKDDAELAQAMRASGLSFLFSTAREVLVFHAGVDTGGKGRDVFERLEAWNATHDVMLLSYRPIHEEMDGWLAIRCAARVPQTERSIERIASAMMQVSQDQHAIGTAFNAALQLVQMSQDGTGEADMRKLFADLDLHERHVLNTALREIAVPQVQAAPAPSAIRRFGLVVDGMAERKVSPYDAAVEQLRGQVDDALAPFWDLDEVKMTGIGLLTWPYKDGDPQGIMFEVSPRAAQAVADALPQHKVIDSDGNIVRPSKQGNAPKPGFTL